LEFQQNSVHHSSAFRELISTEFPDGQSYTDILIPPRRLDLSNVAEGLSFI
jgi:hypothetical protein